MPLSERKEKIIQAIVDRYIETCEPISSSEIQSEYLPSVSSATIRNELSALSDMGYLEQPHTSAGRIPTSLAYRLYVEKLMPERGLTEEEIDIIRRSFSGKLDEIDDVLHSTARVISEITNLTGVAFVKDIKDAIIRNIKIVRVDESSALVLIVTSLGVLKDRFIGINESVPDEYFINASMIASDAFAGHAIKEVNDPTPIIEGIHEQYQSIFDTIIEVLRSYASSPQSREFALEGSSKILEQPEYYDVKKAHAMFRLLESRDQLIPLMNIEDNDISLSINDAKDENDPECAVVTVNLAKDGINVGKAGVIGPTRMDYSKVVAVLGYIGKLLSTLRK